MFDQEKFDNQYRYFVKHRDELVKKYYKRFVVIANENVAGTYLTFREALYAAADKYKPGTFVIQECLPENEEKVLNYDPRRILHTV